MSGFWRFTNNYGSRVSSILDRDDISLEELLDERDTIPELLASNVKLTEYLRQDDVLAALVNFIVEDDDYQRKDALQSTASDESGAITSDNNAITENGDINQNGSNQSTPSDDDSKVGVDVNGIDIVANDDDTTSDDKHNGSHTSSDDDDDDDDNDEEAETETEIHTRRAQVAAEILSVDVWSITDTFMENTDLLQKLWKVLDKPAPLPIFSATYFMKINEHLLDMKTPEMIQFILNEPNLVERFVRHIETPPLMDFMLKVISTDKPDSSTGVIQVLKNQNLITSLISFLSPEISSSIQSAASDFLKAFITISANNAENTTIGPNELSRELVSESTVKMLLNNMVKGGTGLSNGVGIVIEIIRKNNSDYDPVPVVYVSLESHPPSPKDPIYLGTLVRIFSDAIPIFTNMLKIGNEKVLETPFGEIEPLGFERFKICELIAELIHCSNMSLLNEKRGEEIVKERDQVRDVLILKQNELKDDEILNEDETIINEIEKLDLNRPDIEQQKEIDNEDSEIQIIQDESSIRDNPVVGDLLKISLFDNEIIITILEMFFKFPWNNFLHNVVFDIVQQILNAHMDVGFNKFLAIDLFDRCQITNLIINGHNNCLKYETENGLRLGYMGHLTLIAEEVVKFTSLNIHHTNERAVIIDDAIEKDDWIHYVDDILVDIRNKYNSVLGSDGKQMNEHDMELFQKYYGSYEDEEEEEEDEDEDDIIDDEHSDKHNSNNDEDEEILNDDRDDDKYFDSDEEFKMDNKNDSGDINGSGGEDEDDEDDISWGSHSDVVDSEIGGHPYHEMSAGGLDDEIIGDGDVYEEDFDDLDHLEDDYEDPNDDGMSYRKANHPLYQADGSLRSTSKESL